MFDISGEMCTLAFWVPYTIIKYFLRFSMSHNLNRAAFNSHKCSFVCAVLIQVYYSAVINCSMSGSYHICRRGYQSSLDFFLSLSNMNEYAVKWRSLWLMKPNLWMAAVSSILCYEHTYTNCTHFPTSPFPLIVHTPMEMHSCALIKENCLELS